MSDSLATASPEGAPSEQVAGRGRRWLLYPAIILATLTLLVRLFDWDMAAQRWIYDAGGGSWAMGDHPFWRWVYDFGVYPATALVLVASLGLLPWLRPRAVPRWCRICLFAILLGALGPGVVTNLILKEHWGRPRPRQVEELGGTLPFEPVLKFDRSTKGYSFPSGHASMGFYFLGLYLLLHRRRRRLAWAAMGFGLVLGSTLGAARMLQGGHFFSDVVWAAGVCWFVGVGLFYALGFHRSEEEWGRVVRSVPPWASALGAVCGAGMVLGTLVATPYREPEMPVHVSDLTRERPFRVAATLAVGDFEVRSGEAFAVVAGSVGHGVPTSRVDSKAWESTAGSAVAITYRERISGWFSELARQGEMEVPWQRNVGFRLDTGDARVRLHVSEDWAGAAMTLIGGRGTVLVSVPAGAGIGARVVEGPLSRRDARAAVEGFEGFEGFTIIREEGYLGDIIVEDGGR